MRYFGAVGETRTPWGITRSPLTTTLFPRVDCNEHNINTVRKENLVCRFNVATIIKTKK